MLFLYILLGKKEFDRFITLTFILLLGFIACIALYSIAIIVFTMLKNLF